MRIRNGKKIKLVLVIFLFVQIIVFVYANADNNPPANNTGIVGVPPKVDKKLLKTLEDAITAAKELEKTMEKSDRGKAMQIDKAYCDIFDFYFKKGDIQKAEHYLIEHKELIKHRNWGFGESCADNKLNILVNHYFIRKEHDKAINILEKIGSGYHTAVDYYLDKLKDKEKAKIYLEEKIALGDKYLLDWKIENLLDRRARLSKDFEEYKIWRDKILKYKRSKSKDNKMDLIDYYTNTGQVEKAIKEYENNPEWLKDGRNNDYNFLVNNRGAAEEAIAICFWSRFFPGEENIKKRKKFLVNIRT